jgi:hypothetical protein
MNTIIRKRSADCNADGIFTAVPMRESKRRLAIRDASQEQSTTASTQIIPSVVSDEDMALHSLLLKAEKHIGLSRTVSEHKLSQCPDFDRYCDLFGASYSAQPVEPRQDPPAHRLFAFSDILKRHEVAAFALRFNVGSSFNSSSTAANALLSASRCQ